MKKLTIILTILTLAVAACEGDTAYLATGTDEDRKEQAIDNDGENKGEPAGSMWGPCLFEDTYGHAELNGWGCEDGLACAKPLSEEGLLSICVAYSSGGCPVAPFGNGEFVDHAYCTPACDSASDCEDGMECSSFGMCAWPE